MRRILISIIFLLIENESCYAKCPDHTFIGCMLRLKAQSVPIERNIMTLIFNIGTEARLLHTCKVYAATLPCFQEKIRHCGDDKQKRVLNEVSKTIMYLCSPFSLQRQRAVIKHQKCISSVLSLPASTGCHLNDHQYGRQVLDCKKECSNRGSDFICMMRTWISEQNTCTLLDIEQKCGESASSLFKEFQNTVFEPLYPVICNHQSNETKKIVPGKVEVIKQKIIKQHRKPIPKSKTEVQEYALLLTSTQFPTPENIYIPPPPKKTIPSNVYMRPQKPATYSKPSNYSRPIVSNVYQPKIEQSSKLTNVWQKSGISPKIQYNKEMWKQKTKSDENFVFSTQHPLFTTTEIGATPRRHKVIDILKSLIPANFPQQLTEMFENTYENNNFPDSLNTPAEVFGFSTPKAVHNQVTTRYWQGFTTMIPPLPQTLSPSSHLKTSSFEKSYETTSTTTKWKPWYLEGA